MRIKILMTLTVSLLPLTQLAAQPVYCPQHAGYINVGMTQQEVLNACGDPLSKQQPNKPIMQKVPVQQLMYTQLNQGAYYPGETAAFYTQWSIPSGTGGVNLTIQVINNKVSGVTINGSTTNAASVCQGYDIEIGDNVNKVYSACGSPQMVNNSYINQPMPSNSKPEVWIYQVDQYQAPISLTFLNGKLQSID